MKKIVIDRFVFKRPTVVTKEWQSKAISLHETIDEHLETYEDFHWKLVDASVIVSEFQFPLTDYMKWFQGIAQLDDFIKYIQDYVCCYQEGIPVLKIESNLYLKFSKYLWYPEKLTLSKETVNFSNELQKKGWIIFSQIMWYMSVRIALIGQDGKNGPYH